MKTNARKRVVSVRGGRAISVGVQDGIAGSYIAPRYIDVPSIDYNPGSRQYFESVARQLNKSVEIYKKELVSSHD